MRNQVNLRRRYLTAHWGLLFLLVLGGFAARSSGQAVTVTNVPQNHYHYSYPLGNQTCSSGYSFPSDQYPSTYHLERGHFMHHKDPANASNDYWVYWAHFDNSSYSIAEAAVFKSTTQCGPYILQTGLYSQYNTDGAGYGFRPGGWQFRDDTLFQDTVTQTYNADGSVSHYADGYVIAASDSLKTQTSSKDATCSYANDSMVIFKLTQDYLGVDATTNASTNGANFVFICDQREAPVMFRAGNYYFLITSQAAGWYPSQGGYGVSTNPLTGWTADPINLGNASTFGGQTSGGFAISGTQGTTYILTLDHLGGSDSKNPAYADEKQDTGELLLPVVLDSANGTATLNWLPSFTVDNTTGLLTTPTLTNLASTATATSTVASSSTSGTTTYVPQNAIDGLYTTRWNSSASFVAAKPVSTTLCPSTNATSSTTCYPSLVLDLGSVQPVQEVDLSFYMVKGSEPYYTYKLAYSSDNITWSTLDFTAFNSASNAAVTNASAVPFNVNVTYGFNALRVNFSSRYVALLETGAVTQNSTTSPYTSFYKPNLSEIAVILSTAPAVPAAATVTVTPSTTSVSSSEALTVAVNVSGATEAATPSGYVQLSASGYISEIYGLVSGAASFTIPAGSLTEGSQTLTVSYRPDPTSAPVYGLSTTTGTASVTVSSSATD